MLFDYINIWLNSLSATVLTSISSAWSTTAHVSTISVEGCPPLTVTPRTRVDWRYTETTTITLAATRTIYETPWVFTDVVETDRNDRTYGSPDDDFTEHYFEIQPASTTVTIPISRTPALCQEGFYVPIHTTGHKKIIETVTDMPGVTSTLPETQTAMFDTVLRLGTVHYLGVSSITHTRAEATRTAYAACATHKLLPVGIPNRLHRFGRDPETHGYTNLTEVAAIDLEDCCTICHETPDCTLSLYGADMMFFYNKTCRLYQIGDESLCKRIFLPGELNHGSGGDNYKLGGDCNKLSLEWYQSPFMLCQLGDIHCDFDVPRSNIVVNNSTTQNVTSAIRPSEAT